jgi:hypothetical protein
MIAMTPPDSKQIIELLAKLKLETPDYPANMLAVRRAAFISQATTLRIQGKGQGGEGGQQGGNAGSGGSGAALGSSTTAQGIILQAAIGLGLVAAMLAGLLTGSYLVRDQESERTEERVVTSGEFPKPGPVLVPIPSPNPENSLPAVVTPEITVTVTASNTPVVVESDDFSIFDDSNDNNKSNPGLHLGQTPGMPAAPGLGNPGNVNQPDRPDRPDRPKNPGRP